MEESEAKRGMIATAQDSAKRLTPGLLGKMQRGMIEKFDANNPMLTDWQNVKMVLTDATMLNTAKTKGAISDREMALFQKAAADDDLASFSKMQPVFNRLLKFIDSEESSAIKSYQKLYGENPKEWGVVDSSEKKPNEKKAGELTTPSGVSFTYKKK